jgi:hypothetical protein
MRASQLSLLIILIIIACDPKGEFIEATGTLEKQGITSYQYGTHILLNTDQRFALRSKEVRLDSFINMEVRLQGKKVEGYPIEGGPVLIEVADIEKQE